MSYRRLGASGRRVSEFLRRRLAAVIDGTAALLDVQRSGVSRG